MHPTISNTHPSEDLDALLDRLRRIPTAAEEVERRRGVAAEIDRLRKLSLSIVIPIEDLILQEQGENDD